MPGLSGINPVPVARARSLTVAPACTADGVLFADCLSGRDMGLAQALTKALMPGATGRGPRLVHFVLHLAHRGRVSVSACYEHHGWHITLRAQQSATRQWLARQQQTCQWRLARALGQFVRVQSVQEWP